MKRIVVVSMVLLLLGAMVSGAVAGPPKKKLRTLTMTYDLGSYSSYGEHPTYSCGSPRVGCTKFQATSTERYISVDIADLTGQPPLAEVIANGKSRYTFCGATDLPVAIPAGAKVTVLVEARIGPVTACGVVTALPTTGTVTATFSNVP